MAAAPPPLTARDRWHPLVPHLRLGRLSAGKPSARSPKAAWEANGTPSNARARFRRRR
jgi:hypothetical protein